MFGFCKTEKYPDYIIKPNADGSWYITKAAYSGYGIYYGTVNDVRYATLDEAKIGVDNLKREWVKI